MSNDTYKEAAEQAKANLADLRGRGVVDEILDDIRKQLYTPEEIAANELRRALIKDKNEHCKSKKH